MSEHQRYRMAAIRADPTISSILSPLPGPSTVALNQATVIYYVELDKVHFTPSVEVLKRRAHEWID